MSEEQRKILESMFTYDYASEEIDDEGFHELVYKTYKRHNAFKFLNNNERLVDLFEEYRS